MNESKRKIYVLALVLCACALWIGGYVAYRNDRLSQETVIAETYTDVVLGSRPAENVPAIATQPQNGTGGKVPQTGENSSDRGENVPAKGSETVQQTQPKEPLKTAAPIAGDSIVGYSMEALSYNQTTRDWRVHDGVDLAAEAGAEVLAAAAGQVYAVYEDDALGQTVVIRHTDGYATTYACLAEDVPVKAGDAVKLGQAIGTAGETAITEQALGCHVHFSVRQYDEPVDPAAFLALGK